MTEQVTLQYKFMKYLFLFIAGGFSYFYIEIYYRGYSHYSMIICAGIAFILCGLVQKIGEHRFSFVTRMIICCLIITFLEFVTGYFVNIRLGLQVWDYSGLPYNFMGQICLFYSLIWLVLSVFCILLHDGICRYIFDENIPKYKFL